MKFPLSRNFLLICTVLALATSALYWPVRHHDFVNYDDESYVTKNPFVQAGLTEDSLKWAFFRVSGESTYWHPVTWLSHMFDCEVFGLNPGPHHLVSLLIHVFNALLLFALLHRMTGTLWRSAAVAALFSLHPLQVETVAWIAERKNVLSTFFMLITSWFYLRYAEESKVQSPRAKKFYALVILFYAIGLMCKPMLVTLPFIFLLFDFWPLRRVTCDGWRVTRKEARLLMEKVPLFAMAVASSAITILAHKNLGIIMPDAPQFTFFSRLGNVFVSYVRYVGKVFWPTNLSVYYPFSSAWPSSIAIAAGILIIAISLFAFFIARRKPFVFVGWFWFVGALVPVIGIVQANDQAMANRFAYIPVIGLFIVICWAVAEFAQKIAARKLVLSAVTAVLLCMCIAASAYHLKHWKNSEELFNYATQVTKGNNVAWINLGASYESEGRLEEALVAYQKSISIQPTNAMAHSNLGVVFGRLGRLDEAIACFKQSMEINPDHADAYSNLGMALMQQGKLAESVPHFNNALRCTPNHCDAHFNLANVFAQQGKPNDAAEHYMAALKMRPNNADIRNNFGRVLLLQNKNTEAAEQFECALRINPQHAHAHFNLARILISQGRENEAAPHLEVLSRLNPALLESIGNTSRASN